MVFIKYKNRLPDYETTTQLLKNKRIIRSKCNLLINWSYPEGDYDIESVILLRPRNIIIITDVGDLHGAGGYELHDFMTICGVKTKTNKKDSLKNMLIKLNESELEKYNYIYRTFTMYHSPNGLLELSFIS